MQSLKSWTFRKPGQYQHFLSHIFSSSLEDAQRSKCWRCCATAKIGQFSEEFISVPGQKDLAQMHSAICPRPTLPPDKHLMASHTDATVSPHKINVPNVTSLASSKRASIVHIHALFLAHVYNLWHIKHFSKSTFIILAEMSCSEAAQEVRLLLLSSLNLSAALKAQLCLS